MSKKPSDIARGIISERNSKMVDVPIEVAEMDVEELRPRVQKLKQDVLIDMALNYLDTLDADEQEAVLSEYESEELDKEEAAEPVEEEMIVE